MSDDIDQRMAEADQEMLQMGLEALDNCYRAGANPEDLKTVAWIAGIDWSPRAEQRTVRVA